MNFSTTLGGVFIYSENPKPLAEWYSKMFGFTWQNYGKAYYITFNYKTIENEEKSYTIFSILHTENLQKQSKDIKLFTINLRVSDCKSTYEYLKKNDIEVKGLILL
jgi:hypothetical protein